MVTKETPFIGGKSLRFDWDNLEKLNDALGFETLQDFGQFFLESRMGLKHIRIIVWAGLQRPEEHLAVEKVGPLLDEFLAEKSLPELMELIVVALGDSFGKQGEATGEPQKKPPRPSKN